MALLDMFRTSRQRAEIAPSSLPNAMARTGIVTPFADGQLEKFVWNDIFGTDAVPVTRIEAMSVPSVVGGRGLLLGALAGRPLRELQGQELAKPQPSWLYRSNTDVSLWHRMAQTYDDWIFYGDALWAVERGARDQITDAVRIPRDRWSINTENVILVGDTPADKDQVLYLPGPFDGLLNVAAKSIRAAVDLEASWAGRARTPAPAIVLKEKEDNGMDQAEASQYVKAIAQARRDPEGAVMFVPYSLDVSFEGDTASDLMIEARNAVKLDVANFLNLPSSLLDAALPKASLNYQTQEGKEKDLTDRLPYWTEPMEARLSMDDVTARGRRIRFEFDANPEKPGKQTGPYAED